MTVSCRICGQAAHGNHFGVKSCRACALFFRRYANSKMAYTDCRTGNDNSEKCFCRPCRLQRCIRVGMQTEKFQYNRDAILPYKQTTICPTVPAFTGQPEFLMFRSTETIGSKCFIDVQNLISEGIRLLNYGCESPIIAGNQLKKLSLGANFLKFDSTNMKEMKKVGLKEFVDIIEYYFVSVIKWIIQFDEFQKLDVQCKLNLIYSFWLVWMKYHKCSTTADYKRSDRKAKDSHVLMRNMCLNRDKGFFRLDTSWMSDYPHEYVCVYMNSQNIHEDEITESLLKLEPTEVELTYMFAQACFEYTGNRFQGEIQKITRSFSRNSI
uniref:Nuclear receptor domain-containing protein n=1 Tax=Caenorhabditis tropicalis TaxID=1561998 RepID=A0A1I7TAR5_9PELO